jgi:hypothetical protein
MKRRSYIRRRVSKHLVDVDEAALTAAMAELGTDTIKDTVNAPAQRGPVWERRLNGSSGVVGTGLVRDSARPVTNSLTEP